MVLTGGAGTTGAGVGAGCSGLEATAGAGEGGRCAFSAAAGGSGGDGCCLERMDCTRKTVPTATATTTAATAPVPTSGPRTRRRGGSRGGGDGESVGGGEAVGSRGAARTGAPHFPQKRSAGPTLDPHWLQACGGVSGLMAGLPLV